MGILMLANYFWAYSPRDPAVKAEIIAHLFLISQCKQASNGFGNIEIR
jgi:hypothetical protein